MLQPKNKFLPYGEHLKDKYKPGDLVSWREYSSSVGDEPFVTYTGLVVKVYLYEFDLVRKYWMVKVRKNKGGQVDIMIDNLFFYEET